MSTTTMPTESTKAHKAFVKFLPFFGRYLECHVRGVPAQFRDQIVVECWRQLLVQRDKGELFDVQGNFNITIRFDAYLRQLEKAYNKSKRPHRMTAQWHRHQALVGYSAYVRHDLPRFVGLQSGKAEPVGEQRNASREARERAQRKSASERIKRTYKDIPKSVREKEILNSRDKRNPAIQSGRLLSFGGAVVGFAVTKVLSKAYSLMNKGDQLIDETSGFFKYLKNLKATMQQQFKNMWWSIPFVMTIYYLCTHADFISGPIAAFIALSLGPLLGKKLSDVVRPFFEKGIHLQSGSESISQLFATLMAFSVFKNGFKTNIIGEFMKRIALIERTATGWEAFMGWVLKAFETCINYVRVRFGKDRITLLRSGKKYAEDWAKKVDDLKKAVNVCENAVSSEQVDLIVRLVTEGTGMRDLYRGTPVMRVVDDRMGRLYSLLAPFQGSLNARKNFRVEPISLMITGKPGIGKTVSTLYICSAILKLGGVLDANADADAVKSNIWQKGNGKFWNSYCGQAAMILDDAFQWRGDPTDPDNEYMNLIRCKSSWCMPLEFADVASKGRNFFNSKVILGTCNIKSIYSAASLVVHEPEAIGRRFDYSYDMVICPEYATPQGRLDKTKFDLELVKCRETQEGINCFPWYIWRMHPHNFMTGVTSPEWRPMLDVILEAANDLKGRMQQHGTDEVTFDAFVNGIRPQAGREINSDDSSSDAGSFTREVLDMQSAYTVMLKEELQRSKEATASMAILLGAGFGIILLPTLLSVLRGVLSTAWAFLTGIFGLRKKKSIKVQSNAPLTKSTARGKSQPTLQAGDDHLQYNAYNNSYKLVIMEPSPYVVGQILFLCDQLAVQPEHFTSVAVRERLASGVIDMDTKIKFIHASQSQFTFEVSVRQYLSYRRISDPDHDVEFIKVDDIRAHRNIVSSFLTEKQIKYADGVRAVLDLCSVERSQQLVAPTRNLIVLGKTSLGYNLKVGGRKMLRYFKYSAPTDCGDCGAPVSLMESSSFSGHAVYGIHACGDTKRQEGYCAVVTCDMIQSAMTHLNIIRDDFVSDLNSRGLALQAGDTLPYSVSGSFLPIGTVDKSIASAPYSSFYKTSMYGAFGDYKCLPAPLSRVVRNGSYVQPMDNAVKPYSTPVLIIDTTHLRDIKHVAFRRLTEMTAAKTNRPLYTFEEAVLGIPEEKFRSIPRGTSAGWPYSLDNIAGGKRDFFGEGEEYDLTGPRALELRKRVEYVLSSAKSGVRLAHVFQDFLKDELRPEEKVENVATRLISSAPLDYTIAWRMMFGAFSAQVMRYHTDTGMAPGICVYTDWHHLANHLTSKGDKVFAGDFKSFDSSEQPCVMAVILEYINEWYNDGPENALIRQVLWAELAHSRHIGGFGKDQRHIIQWNKSLPSGHPFTTILNSMYSLLLLVACYVELTGDWTGFWNKCFTITYGDDNVSNVADDVAVCFNQVTVAEVMLRKYGMIYTSDTKKGELVPYTDIAGVSFLKRRIFNDENRWKCPLELDSFLFSPYWCKNKRLEHKIRVDELENALEELSMHEQSTWDAKAPMVYAALSNFQLPKAPLRREAYYREVVSRGDNWY
nr:MAG: RNA dependent RNA polymerase [Picornaviridae sp.]